VRAWARGAKLEPGDPRGRRPQPFLVFKQNLGTSTNPSTKAIMSIISTPPPLSRRATSSSEQRTHSFEY